MPLKKETKYNQTNLLLKNIFVSLNAGFHKTLAQTHGLASSSLNPRISFLRNKWENIIVVPSLMKIYYEKPFLSAGFALLFGLQSEVDRPRSVQFISIQACPSGRGPERKKWTKAEGDDRMF